MRRVLNADPSVLPVYEGIMPVEYLGKKDVKNAIAWLRNWMVEVINTTEKVVKELTPLGYISNADVKYFRQSDITAIRTKREMEFQRLFLYNIALASVKSGISCQEILFGTPEGTPLLKDEEEFLSLAAAAGSLYGKLVQIYRPNPSNPVYNLKLRMLEICDHLGLDYRTAFDLDSFTPYSKKLSMQFLNHPVSRTVIEKESLDYYCSYNGLYTIILFACHYGCTMDRLLLQDFSKSATHANGKMLTREERSRLSHYLLLSEEDKLKMFTDLYLYSKNLDRHL